MKKYISLIIAVSLLIGCMGVKSTVIKEADGTTGLMIICKLDSPEKCLEEADRRCPGNFMAYDSKTDLPGYPGFIQHEKNWFYNAQCVKLNDDKNEASRSSHTAETP